jgi:regulator of protease activity HflC (stomatin/prohibitin superfamily)
MDMGGFTKRGANNANSWQKKLKQWVPFLFFIFLLLGFKSSLVIIIIAIIFLLFIKYKHKFSPEIAPGIIDGDKFMDPSTFKAGRFGIGIIGALAIILVLIASIVIIDAGEVGVYSIFGKVRNEALQSGFHLINPFAKINRMSVRTEEYTMSKATNEGKIIGDDSIPALTREGLSLTLDITTLFHLEPNRAPDIYKELGVDFEAKIIRPEIRSIIRETIALYDAKDIYSEKRDEVVGKIQDKLFKKLEPRGIVVEDVLLRDVTLPANLAQSIQEKLQAEQESQKYDFILQKEKKEADRKRIEAAGQRDSQKIINESLTTNYLYYQYINTLKDRQGTIYVPTNPSTGMPQFKELGQ